MCIYIHNFELFTKKILSQLKTNSQEKRFYFFRFFFSFTGLPFGFQEDIATKYIPNSQAVFLRAELNST